MGHVSRVLSSAQLERLEVLREAVGTTKHDV